MSLYRDDLLKAISESLISADTLAGPNVFVGRTQPVTNEALPALFLWCPEDRSESSGPNAISFKRTATIAIKALVQGGTEDTTRAFASVIAEQIEMSILTSTDVTGLVSDIPSMHVQTHVSSEGGDHNAEVRYLFELTYYEDFNPFGVPLSVINGTIKTASNADFAQMRVNFQK